MKRQGRCLSDLNSIGGYKLYRVTYTFAGVLKEYCHAEVIKQSQMARVLHSITTKLWNISPDLGDQAIRNCGGLRKSVDTTPLEGRSPANSITYNSVPRVGSFVRFFGVLLITEDHNKQKPTMDPIPCIPLLGCLRFSSSVRLGKNMTIKLGEGALYCTPILNRPTSL